MAASDAKPVPRKNIAFRVTFPIYDADGDLVTAAATPDSERSIDGGTFVDCTNEATEIATGSGIYFLDLTAAEMNGDTVAVIVKTATAGAKTTAIIMYPQETGDIRVDIDSLLGTTIATPTVAGVPEVDITHVAGAAELISSRLDVAVSTRMATFTLPTNFAAMVIDGSGIVDADVRQWLGTAAAAPTVAGVPEVDVTHVAGTLQTAGDIIADTNDIQARLPTSLISGRMSATLALVNGTADSGSTTTMVDAARTEADTDYWKGDIIVFTSGILLGESRLITAFDAATDTITFAPPTTVAVGTHNYDIIPAGRADVELWDGVAVNALIAGRVDASVGAMAADVITATAIATDAIGAAEIAAAGANKIADHTLRRTYANARASANGDAVAFRSLLGGLGKLVNKWSISGTTLTVFQEDDVTSTAPGGTQTITGTAGANPITQIDTD